MQLQRSARNRQAIDRCQCAINNAAASWNMPCGFHSLKLTSSNKPTSKLVFDILIPVYLLNQLQAVMNAGARLIFNVDKREHTTPLLRQLHWLHVPDWITFKLATLMFQCINETGLEYLSSDVRHVADVPGRKHLRSAASSLLIIPATRRSIGDRALVVAAVSVWNKLPQDIRSATSLSVFRRRLKTHFFDKAYNC